MLRAIIVIYRSLLRVENKTLKIDRVYRTRRIQIIECSLSHIATDTYVHVKSEKINHETCYNYLFAGHQ